MDPARTFAAPALAILALAALVDASAQQIYKIVGPDGRITFSDQATVDPSGPKSQAAKVVPFTPEAGGATGAGLPFELRQAVARYPVTLYTSPGCQTCAQGRQMLLTRGIPFSERTVATKEDADALQRLAGTQAVPVLAIGSQQLRGYSDLEWTQFLNAAGYPKVSLLPSSYVPPAATPLVALDQRPAPAAPAAAAAQGVPTAPAQPPRPAEPPPANPAGIAF